MFSERKKVRVEGLEPPHLTALDPKSSVSTNFTTPAKKSRKYKTLPLKNRVLEIILIKVEIVRKNQYN